MKENKLKVFHFKKEVDKKAVDDVHASGGRDRLLVQQVR